MATSDWLDAARQIATAGRGAAAHGNWSERQQQQLERLVGEVAAVPGLERVVCVSLVAVGCVCMRIGEGLCCDLLVTCIL